ncbi:MAG: hypothetical protein KAW82_00075 [Desulfurellaceae bacterium]|nr:hypothetical protein [Desulfurellaceae bacterium]
MNKGLLFMMFGVFLFLTLLCVPAKAEDIMSWSPRLFAGGAFAPQEDLLNTAIVIKNDSGSLYNYSDYYSYYYDSYNDYSEHSDDSISASGNNATAAGGDVTIIPGGRAGSWPYRP